MIIVLTLNNPHRKTQDVILKLLAHGIRPMVVATEWEIRKNFVPLIKHRPTNAINISLSKFCKNLNLDLIITEKRKLYDVLSSINNIKKILLSTGSIIENKIASKFDVINSHPGYLPIIKGLDALKWSILLKEKIGVTTHFINDKIDSGLIIERKIVPIYFEDSFHNLAYRQYELEINMLINALFCTPRYEIIQESPYETFRRMPHRFELRMLETFNDLRKNTQIKDIKF